MNDAAEKQPPFRFVAHWKRESAEDEAAVLAFWQRESALAGDAQANARLREIVVDARTPQGEVAGVCTAVPMNLPRLGQPVYYYRCFIGSAWRKTRLVFNMMLSAFEVLEAYARANDFPCIGVVLELENSRFGDSLRTALWPHTQFVYIGKSRRGLDLRVRYFRGAKLKTPPA
ncbi:MAG TPA: hypothetical protein VFB32_09060 [Rudaea sp.]|nr:hypothetical protein [Rudaea sp.]